VANDCEYGLSSSIFTNDAVRVFRFVDEIETGMTHINSRQPAEKRIFLLAASKARASAIANRDRRRSTSTRI